MRRQPRNPVVYQLDRLYSNDLVDLFQRQPVLVHDDFVESPDEGEVLLSQKSQLVVSGGSLAPLARLLLLFRQDVNDAFELENLVIDRIHLVFIFKQVVLVDVLDLELVILGPACLYAVTIVEHHERVLARCIPARANRSHILIGEDPVALGEHLNELLLADLEEVSSRVVALLHVVL